MGADDGQADALGGKLDGSTAVATRAFDVLLRAHAFCRRRSSSPMKSPSMMADSETQPPEERQAPDALWRSPGRPSPPWNGRRFPHGLRTGHGFSQRQTNG